jgi:hypothetical protein
MNQLPFKQLVGTQRILWLVGSLLIGFFVGNIVFGLPFAALLYWGVPETQFSRRWKWWMRIDPALRALLLVAVMYVFMMLSLVAFGPWLTAGMGQ